MASRLGIALLIVLALSAAGYLWFKGLPPTPGSGVPAATSTPEAATAEPPIGSIRTGVVGSWRSDADAKFTREFRANGTVVDRYQGNDDATVTGSWHIVTDSSSLPVQLRDLDAGTLLEISFPEETLYFTVSKVDEDELVMTYAGAGPTLSFTRVE